VEDDFVERVDESKMRESSQFAGLVLDIQALIAFDKVSLIWALA
jgi:hypothetical protein